MLVGEPQTSFDLDVTETEGEWIARTEAVVLHVNKTPFRLWATDVHNRIFFSSALGFVYLRHF